METIEQKLREEWRTEYHRPEGFVVAPEQADMNTDRIADWWLSKLSSILEEKREMIEKLPTHKTRWNSRDKVYKEDIISILNEK